MQKQRLRGPDRRVLGPADGGEQRRQGHAPGGHRGNGFRRSQLEQRRGGESGDAQREAESGGPSAWLEELVEVAPSDGAAEDGWGAMQSEVDALQEEAQAPEPKQEQPAADPGLGVTDAGRAEMDRMAAAARPWYSSPRGKCYAAVAGYSAESYTNRAGGRWKQLADRIPGSHAMWAVSFAHWLQETSHGQQAARELGFEILESDGKTPLGEYLAAHPELKGAVTVVPYGQQGTASQEWNAAGNYGEPKWGAGVGDISVVTSISGRGATHVADGTTEHDAATMWWIVYPK